MGKLWRKALAVTLVLLLAAVAAGCAKPEPADPAGNTGKLAVHIIDVGQGDAILIQAPARTVLIDTGDVPAREKLVKYLKDTGVKTIDTLIITHPHADHLGGAPTVLKEFTVKEVYDSGQKTTTALFRDYLNIIDKRNIPFKLARAGQVLDLGDGVQLAVLAPREPLLRGTESDLNNNSVVARLAYGRFSMLLTGDAEKEAEERLLADKANLASTVLKVGHHGSRTSSFPGFLKAVKPEAGVICVGENNDYHHPHTITLKRLRERNINVFRTDEHGTVLITADGQTYEIKTEKKRKEG